MEMNVRGSTAVPLMLCWMLLLLLSPVSTRPGGISERESAAHHSHHHSHHHHSYHHHHHSHTNSTRCVNGHLRSDHTCVCHPCWDGPSCTTYVDLYAPRFLVHAATAVLPLNATGVVYRAWSTDEDLGLTCPLGPGESARCPCASVTYQLFAPPGDRHFQLDPVSGILSRPPPSPTLPKLHPGATYTYKLMVQGTPVPGQVTELLYDLLDLRIYVSADYVKKIPWT